MPDWTMTILQTLLAVVVLFAMTKLLGKRQISQLSLFEYITGITIGNMAAHISLDKGKDWYLGILSIAVWVLVALGIELITLKSRAARNFIDNKATVLIERGKILEKNLHKERLTADELMENLRARNVFRVADVEFAVMEQSGGINVLLTKENRPVTPRDVGMLTSDEHEPQIVIMDGSIMDEPLSMIGKDKKWLDAELNKLGVTVDDVYLAQADSNGQLHVDLYDDKRPLPKPQKKEGSPLSVLFKCEADLELLRRSAQNPQEKRLYAECSQELGRIISDVKMQLKQN